MNSRNSRREKTYSHTHKSAGIWEEPNVTYFTSLIYIKVTSAFQFQHCLTKTQLHFVWFFLSSRLLFVLIYSCLFKADLVLRRMSDGSVSVDGTPVHSCSGSGSRRGSSRAVPHGPAHPEPTEPATSEPVSISNCESNKNSMSLNVCPWIW